MGLARLNRSVTPARVCALAIAVCLLLAMLPARWLAPLRRVAADGVDPGRHACVAAGDALGRFQRTAIACLASADRLASAEADCRRMAGENALLRAELDALRAARLAERSAPDGTLLVPHAIPACVLGQQSRAYLARRNWIDVGEQAGGQPGDWVIALPALVDRGRRDGLRSGDLALSGRCLWGQVVEVGAHVSAVRTVTDAGYRGVVQLVSPDRPASAADSPQGVVEGTGEALARVRLVPVTEAVAVGDWVVTADADGFLPEPLLVGRVERLERTDSASHWEIWISPAVPPGRPPALALLRPEPNPVRMAAAALPDPNAEGGRPQ